MGENFSNPSHAEQQQPLLVTRGAEEKIQPNGASPANGEDEPYTIKCICGFNDDAFDGNTVFCEHCNTWQHISCYYFPETTLADEFFHDCVDCKPRPINASAAIQRQRQLRDPLDARDERKAKRPNHTKHRKTKTKDVNPLPPQANGWILHKLASAEHPDVNNREQGPPTKRSKTDHRQPGSLNARPAAQRHRSGTGGSTTSQGRPLLSASLPDYLSAEFINVHHHNTSFETPDTNLHLNIRVTDLLSRLLDDQEYFAKVTNGLTHNDVFMKFDQIIDNLENPVRKNIKEDKNLTYHGNYPVWPYLTTEKDLVSGEVVGELRGYIGGREDYKQDPANRWDELRHPDHFVFFHPHLPIFIDSRVEGTKLRYARRSCRPNMEMKTIITGAREYRFCFTAVTGIPKDAELTVAWDLADDPDLQRHLVHGSETMTNVDRAYVRGWVGRALAHFGGCACETNPANVCLLGHFVRRLGNAPSEAAPRSNKTRKRKITKTTPPNTGHTTNSPASSEGGRAPDLEGDVDMDGPRSPSKESGKTSRDETPSEKLDASLGPGDELSERDKRKLLQQERLFEQMEQDHHTGPRKKKRNSGSNVNTPTVPNSRPVGQSIAASSGPEARQRKAKTNSASGDDRTPRSGEQSPRHARDTPHSRGSALRHQVLRPVYVDASTQTAKDESSISRPTSSLPVRPRPFVSMAKRLLHQTVRRNLVRGERPAPTSQVSSRSRSPKAVPVEANDEQTTDLCALNAPRAVQSTMTEKLEVDTKNTEPPVGIDMVAPPGRHNTELDAPGVAETQSPIRSAHPPLKPPPPPWPSEESNTIKQVPAPRKDVRDAGMHVDLPSPGFFKSPLAQSPSSFPGSAPMANMIQSPVGSASTPGVPTPNVQSPTLPRASSLTKPSPAKKKMSLSDYMNKRKTTETSASERTQSQAQPDGHVSPPGAMGSAKDEATAPKEPGAKREDGMRDASRPS
ncbi:MAG: hypothetical protein M1828_001014 [Chrysothrix sp. TS-e1954]|nr:MAG: hypothetical protein M1828_001014 [Chrysothrix sp. TS-e1954]